MKIDLEQIRDLLKAVSQTDISELTIESGDEKITVRKGANAGVASVASAPAIETSSAAIAPPAVPKVATVQAPEVHKPNNNKVEDNHSANNSYVPITSPMVGTFYRSPSPTAPSFVEVGDHVNLGQTVCIIEAMKLMNDLPSEVSGKIVKVLVENGTTVEFGQGLFLVDPAG